MRFLFTSVVWCGAVSACSCNGLSTVCYFDEEMYQLTGHGGHCTECQQNTDGPHCERCQRQFYRPTPVERCQHCACNPVGKCTAQWRFYVGARGGTGPQNLARLPQFFRGNLGRTFPHLISLSRCCVPNDEGPGPPNIFS